MDNVLSVAFCHIGTGIHIGRRQYTNVCICFLPLKVLPCVLFWSQLFRDYTWLKKKWRSFLRKQPEDIQNVLTLRRDIKNSLNPWLLFHRNSNWASGEWFRAVGDRIGKADGTDERRPKGKGNIGKITSWKARHIIAWRTNQFFGQRAYFMAFWLLIESWKCFYGGIFVLPSVNSNRS